MAAGMIWTLLALVATPWTLFTACKNLGRNELQREDILSLLGIAFFLLMFLPIPFVYAGALFGYWTPRLILPSLLYFFLAAFLLIDRRVTDKSGKATLAVLLFVCLECVIELAMLT